MSGDGSAVAFIIENEGVDPKTGQKIAHYYTATTAPLSVTPATTATPAVPAITATHVPTNDVVQTAKPKPAVVYTHEVVAAPNPAPTQAPPSQPVTAVAIPSKATQQYPVIPDQPPSMQYQAPEQYTLAQYPVEEPYPYTPADEYASPPPQYNTHPCVKLSIVLLFLLVIGVGVWFGLKLYGVIS